MAGKEFNNREIWNKATEILEDLPGFSKDGFRSVHGMHPSLLVSSLPQKRALEQVGLPAALYDQSGQRVEGPDVLPRILDVAQKNEGWSSQSDRNGLLVWHSVLVDRERFVLCILLDAQRLHALNPATTELTKAEFSVLCGLASGLSLREIATQDGVSYSTRRRQAEAVTSKLGVQSQVAAVRLVYTTVIDRLLAALSLTDETSSGIDVLSQLYGVDVRLHWIQLTGGPPLRVAEFGDPSGRPILLFHPLLLPFGCSRASIQAAERRGLRVICPLRPGFYDAPTWARGAGLENVVGAWSDRLNALMQFMNLSTADIVGIAFSAPWVVDFSRRYPKRARSVIFLSAPQPHNVFLTSKTTSFLHSISAIVAKTPWLSEPIVRLHSMRVHNFNSAVSGFRKTFSTSDADLQEIEELIHDRTTFQTVAASLQNSIKGVAMDMRLAAEPWDAYLAGIEAPLHFVHGQHDAMCEYRNIERLAESLPQAQFHLCSGKGHLFYIRGFTDALTKVLST